MSQRFTTLAKSSCLALLILQGCNTTQVDIPDPTYETTQIQRGSPAEDLIAIWGKPNRIEIAREQPIILEAWIYIRESSKTEMIDTGTIEVPYVHPLTGREGVMHEIVSAPQTTTLTETITVYVSEGYVLSWKSERNQNRDISQ